MSEVGDIGRFDNRRQLMGYLGLVPSERSTGDIVQRGGITKAGNRRVRHMLVESAWTYRHPPRLSAHKLYILEKLPAKICEIASKAQTRLTARYRVLAGRDKRMTVVCTAIARELVGFMWSVAREVRPARPETRRNLRAVAHGWGWNRGRGTPDRLLVAGWLAGPWTPPLS